MSLRPAISLVVLILAAGVAHADRMEPLPKELEGVGITEKLGAQLPKDLLFKDSTGRDVTLGELLASKKPTLLTLNYSNCPMLCGVQLNGFVEGLKAMKWDPGEEFQIITVSLDPNEPLERTASTKARYMADYNRPGHEAGWHFLVGSEQNVRAVADAVGFGYAWVEERKEYAHAPAVMVLSPEGRVSRYLYGILYDAPTIRLSLAEAQDGKTRSTLDALILFCFHYDATAGKYAPAAKNFMRLGGALTVVALSTILGSFFRREQKKKRLTTSPAVNS